MKPPKLSRSDSVNDSDKYRHWGRFILYKYRDLQCSDMTWSFFPSNAHVSNPVFIFRPFLDVNQHAGTTSNWSSASQGHLSLGDNMGHSHMLCPRDREVPRSLFCCCTVKLSTDRIVFFSTALLAFVLFFLPQVWHFSFEQLNLMSRFFYFLKTYGYIGCCSSDQRPWFWQSF